MEAEPVSTVIEPCAPFESTTDLVIGPSLRALDQPHAFHRRTMTAEIVNWRMRDVTLFPPIALVFKDDKPVAKTRFCVFDREVDAAARRLAEPRFRFDGSRAFMGFNRPCVNYFHIVTQIIPAIASYVTDPEFWNGILLLPELIESLHDTQTLITRAMDLAGIRAPNTIRLGAEPLGFQDLTFSSYLTGYESVSLFSRAVFDCMIENADSSSDAGKPSLIYIARTDTPARPMRNEDALVKRLSLYGIKAVVLSSFSLDEQITLFQNARLIIGAHGAGLANIVFSRPGTVLYELLPSHYPTACIAHLAQMRGLHYWCDAYQSEDRPGTWRHHIPWSVDLDWIEHRIAEIVTRYAPGW